MNKKRDIQHEMMGNREMDTYSSYITIIICFHYKNAISFNLLRICARITTILVKGGRQVEKTH